RPAPNEPLGAALSSRYFLTTNTFVSTESEPRNTITLYVPGFSPLGWESWNAVFSPVLMGSVGCCRTSPVCDRHAVVILSGPVAPSVETEISTVSWGANWRVGWVTRLPVPSRFPIITIETWRGVEAAFAAAAESVAAAPVSAPPRDLSDPPQAP